MFVLVILTTSNFWLMIMILIGLQIWNFWWLRTYTRSNLSIIWIITYKIVWLRSKLFFHYFSQILKQQQSDLETQKVLIQSLKNAWPLSTQPRTARSLPACLHPVIFCLALSTFIKKDCQLKNNLWLQYKILFIKTQGQSYFVKSQ